MDEQGQTMAEYGVVLTVITLVLIGVFAAFSGAVQGSIVRAAEALASAL